MCPKNTDPWITTQVHRVIGLNIHSNNPKYPIQGSLGIKLYGITTYINMLNITNNTCVTALESSNQIGTVSCNVQILDAYNIHMIITFMTWPSINIADNNIYTNNGNPAITDFSCDVSQMNIPFTSSNYVVNSINHTYFNTTTNSTINITNTNSITTYHNNTVLCQFYDIVSENIQGKCIYMHMCVCVLIYIYI